MLLLSQNLLNVPNVIILEVINYKLCIVMYKCMCVDFLSGNWNSIIIIVPLGGGGVMEYLMRFELICCPMSGVIELGSVKPPCRPHLSPDGSRWGNTLIGALTRHDVFEQV